MKRNEKYSNEELIEGIRNMDNNVLKHIIDLCQKPVRHYIVTNNGSSSDAEDVLQEAMIVLFRKVKDVNFKLTASISTFIFSIARLIWLKEINRKQESLSPLNDLEVFDNDNILDTIEKNERLKLYQEKFDELKEDCKKILRLFYLGTSMKQITQIMGFGSEDYTKKRKYMCKNTLIDKIKNSKEFKELGHGNHN